MKLRELTTFLEEIAPLAYQEDYDNSGLIVGNQDIELSGALISLDCTESVIDEAIQLGFNLIISHHPIVFKGLKKFNGNSYVERVVMKAIKHDIAIYAIHTNLDHILQGVNKKICEKLDIRNASILKVKEGQEIKFTVPEATRDVFDAEVHLVGKSIEGNDRTINVHGHLDPKIRQRLLTGMFVDAGIVVDSKKGLSIPVEALITANNKSAVLLLQGQKGNTYTFKKVAVTVGEKSERFVEILPNSEINASSAILIKGVFELVD